MSCKAKLNGEVKEKGKVSMEFYKEGKPQYYCYGWKDSSTDEFIETCKNCKVNVIYAQEDFGAYAVREGE